MERMDFLGSVGLAATLSTCSQMALNIASVAVCLLIEGSASSAGVLLKRKYDWYFLRFACLCATSSADMALRRGYTSDTVPAAHPKIFS